MDQSMDQPIQAVLHGWLVAVKSCAHAMLMLAPSTRWGMSFVSDCDEGQCLDG